MRGEDRFPVGERGSALAKAINDPSTMRYLWELATARMEHDLITGRAIGDRQLAIQTLLERRGPSCYHSVATVLAREATPDKLSQDSLAKQAAKTAGMIAEGLLPVGDKIFGHFYPVQFAGLFAHAAKYVLDQMESQVSYRHRTIA